MHATNNYRKRSHTFEILQGTEQTTCNWALSPLIYLRAEFHKNRGVGKKDFGTIEYLLRRGRRQLETYQDPGIRDLH
jgi:hypothetical protein